MYAEVDWVLVSSEIQVQSQVILDPDYLPDYLSFCYDYVFFTTILTTNNRNRVAKKSKILLLLITIFPKFSQMSKFAIKIVLSFVQSIILER